MAQFFTSDPDAAVLTLAQEKLANKQVLLALDQALQAGAELDLHHFQVPAGSYCLHNPAVQLSRRPVAELPDDIARASPGRLYRVFADDTDTADEEPTLAIQWQNENRRVLHMHIDQGSVGLPSKLYLVCIEKYEDLCGLTLHTEDITTFWMPLQHAD